MPVPSAFSWPGAADCSGNPTHIETIYFLLQALWGTEIDFSEVGSDDELHLYATAVVLGSALYELEHAGNQADPLLAYELLPLLEQQFGLVPGPRDNVPTRQAALAAAELLPLGCVISNLVNSVKNIAGSASFLAYVAGAPTGSPTVYPSSPGITDGQFLDVRVPARLVELVDPVVVKGDVSWCAYRNVDPTIEQPVLLQAGDIVMVGAGNTSVMESTAVFEVSPTVQPGCTPGYNYFLATFNAPHDVGSAVTTGSFPYWWSTQRLSLVVLTAAAAVNRPLRAKIDALLTKLVRAVDTWAIVQATSTFAGGGTVGPLVVGAPMGTLTIGEFDFENSM